MKSLDLAICTAVMAMKLQLITDAETVNKKNSIFLSVWNKLTYKINLTNMLYAISSVYMSKRLAYRMDQSQPPSRRNVKRLEK
jgi:hypothetical protein